MKSDSNWMFFKGRGTRANEKPWIIITGIHVAEIAATVTTYELVRALLFNREGFNNHPDIHLLRRATSDLHFIDDGANRNHLFATERQANDGIASQMHRQSWKEAEEDDEKVAICDVFKIKYFIDYAVAAGACALVSLHAMGFPTEFVVRAYASEKAINKIDSYAVETLPAGWKHDRINWGSIPTHVDEKYGIPAVDLEFHAGETDLMSAKINAEYVIKVLEMISR